MGQTARVAIAVLAVVVLLVHGSPAAAYSYGDPTREALADAYTAFAGALGAPSPDWTAAEQQVQAVADEARLHFGPCPVQRLQAAVAERDAGASLAAFRQLLVLNIARRLASVRESLGADYPMAKNLLAKAFATYEALSPLVKADDPELDARLRADFDAMLHDLGNPGLFGVGKRDPDPEDFDRRREAVVRALQQRFGPERIEVGHFTEGGDCAGAEQGGEGGERGPGGDGEAGTGRGAPGPNARGLLWLGLLVAGAAGFAYAWWRWLGGDDSRGS